MVYSKLNLDTYPKFHRAGTAQGTFNANLIYHSKYLKEGAVFPLKGTNSELNRLSSSLGAKMASLHTALHLGAPQLRRIRIVPDSGTLEEGAQWLLPHVDAYNMVSFDTESCHRLGGLSFSIFGAADGFALIVDHRGSAVTELCAALRPLVKGRLVLGSGLAKQDSHMLSGLNCKLGDTQTLSRALQDHPNYPYEAPNCPAGRKTGLKHVPEMLFGHCYGPLSLVTRKGTGFEEYQERQGFRQPFEWPAWLYPSKMYTFKKSPPSQEQIAYMYNDAISPFLHLMLMGMLHLSEGSLSEATSVPEVLSLTARNFFGQVTASCQNVPLETYPNKFGQAKFFLSEFLGKFLGNLTRIFEPKIVIDCRNVTAGTVGTDLICVLYPGNWGFAERIPNH